MSLVRFVKMPRAGNFTTTFTKVFSAVFLATQVFLPPTMY